MGYFVVFFIVILIICALIPGNKREEEGEQKKLIEIKNKIYEEKKKQYNINENYLTVNYENGFARIAKTLQYIWVEKGEICFFPAYVQENEEKYILYKIPIENLEYFATRGSISKETKISGGGGQIGGSSIGGAVVGGLLAGGAGAVIGSRKKGKIEPIKSKIITHDDRETFLNYFVDGVKHSMFFKYGDYATLLKIIPQKEHKNFVNTHVSSGSKPSIKEQLIDLADLKEKGILTEQEFNEKKKILIDKIK